LSEMKPHHVACRRCAVPVPGSVLGPVGTGTTLSAKTGKMAETLASTRSQQGSEPNVKIINEISRFRVPSLYHICATGPVLSGWHPEPP